MMLKLDIHVCNRVKVDHFLRSYTKITIRIAHKPSCVCKIIKHLEESKGANYYLDPLDPKSISIKHPRNL